MITIKLEIASNGIIKTVMDDNYNGAGYENELRKVYETDNDIGFENTTKFLYEVCDDLGVDLGNKFDRRVLNFEVGWGGRYEPASEEIDALIKALTYELKELKILKKEIKTLKEIDSLHTNEIDN